MWRRATEDRWKGAFAGVIKGGEERVTVARVSPGLVWTRTMSQAWVTRLAGRDQSLGSLSPESARASNLPESRVARRA